MSREFTPLKELRRENLSKKSSIPHNENQGVLEDIAEIKRSLSRMESRKILNATSVDELKVAAATTTRRLTSLWHARRNKSMIHQSQASINLSMKNKSKQHLDERMSQQVKRMKNTLESRRRLRSHDTDMFNMSVLVKIKRIYEEEFKAVTSPLLSKDQLQLSKTQINISKVHFSTIAEEEDLKSASDQNILFMTARNSFSQLTKNRP